MTELQTPEDVWRLPSEVIEKYQKRFSAMDLNKDGVVTIRELAIRGAAFGNKVSIYELKRIFGKEGLDDSGQITFEEFVIGIEKRMESIRHLAPLRPKFFRFDWRRKGYFTVDDMHKVLKQELGFGLDKCEMLMFMFDKDKDYKIGLDEFRDFNDLVESMVAEVRHAFGTFDEDRDHYVSEREFYKKGFSREQVQNIMAQHDTDGDGKLNFQEFAAFYDCPLRKVRV